MTTNLITNNSADPYNYPFPQRKDLMSLSTINNLDTGKSKINLNDLRQRSLNTKDIDGAQSQIRGYKFTNKQTYQIRNDDIQGS